MSKSSRSSSGSEKNVTLKGAAMDAHGFNHSNGTTHLSKEEMKRLRAEKERELTQLRKKQRFQKEISIELGLFKP
ncbi:hypothetical protein K8I28_05200 [bacterium]|nr:hypothetical protein [bacterium]